MLGVLCERPHDGKAPGKQNFEVSSGYRYLPSSRHFIGTVEQKRREIPGTQIRNDVHIFDFSLAYQVSKRLSVFTTMPFLKLRRDQLYVPSGVFNFKAQGDATLAGATGSSSLRQNRAAMLELDSLQRCRQGVTI